jgi:hypothetical protein
MIRSSKLEVGMLPGANRQRRELRSLVMRIAWHQLEDLEVRVSLPELRLAGDSMLEVVGGHETVTFVS